MQTNYDKADGAIPPPKTIFKREAEKMGEFDFSKVDTGPRIVPDSPEAFVAARSEYQKQMSAIRKSFASQWAARRERESAAVKEYQEGVRQRKAENDALREQRRLRRAKEHDKQTAMAREARQLRKAAQMRENERAIATVDERRAAWLDALEADAANWITEERIDELITPQSFSMKYAWQYARWFEAKEAKRSLLEAARRAKKPGVPLREIELSDQEYATDWESELEEPAVAAAAAAADRNAASDPTGKVALALAAARRAARAEGAVFPEPAYDDEGRPLQPAGTPLERMKVSHPSAHPPIHPAACNASTRVVHHHVTADV